MFFRSFRQLWPLFAGFLAALPAMAANEAVQVELVSEAVEVRPGDSFRAGVKIAVAEGWHIYGEEPGLTGLPTTVEWNLPEGATAGPVRYPPTVPFVFLGEEGEGYKGTIVLWSLIETSPNLEAPLTLEANVSWLVCREICVPGSVDVSLTVPVAEETLLAEEMTPLFGEFETPPPAAALPETAEKAVGPLIYILLGGFLGGLILNLMPCVFPIIGIKIMGFVNQAGEERRKIVAHGLVFSFGVLVSFWILAGVLIALRMGGEELARFLPDFFVRLLGFLGLQAEAQELGWGFQLQKPGFVLVLTAILLVFGLSMSGVFEIGFSAVGVGSRLMAKNGMAGSFFSGVLATVVATPCAAPILAPALGIALILPPIESLLVFTAIGLGLALPYLTLSAFPGLVKLLPRPGEWMETLKQFLSFLLYGTVAFFLWVLADLVGERLFLVILFALVAMAMGCWVYGRWAAPHRPKRSQWIARVVALLLLITPLAYTWNGIAEEDRRRDLVAQIAAGAAEQDFLIWEPWSAARERELRDSGRFVYIDFTARWCVTCQVNKRAYDNPEVIRAFLANDVALLKADWTNQDPAITRALAEFDRQAVPFNLLYAPGNETPLILPELFGAGTVLEKLKEAGANL